MFGLLWLPLVFTLTVAKAGSKIQSEILWDIDGVFQWDIDGFDVLLGWRGELGVLRRLDYRWNLTGRCSSGVRIRTADAGR